VLCYGVDISLLRVLLSSAWLLVLLLLAINILFCCWTSDDASSVVSANHVACGTWTSDRYEVGSDGMDGSKKRQEWNKRREKYCRRQEEDKEDPNRPSVCLDVCMVNDSDIDRAAVLLRVVLMCMNLLTLLSPVTSYRCAVLNLSHRVIASSSLQFGCWSLRL